MTLVIDASVALKWFFRDRDDEPGAEVAQVILQMVATGEHAVLQPPHFMAEVCAVLARESPQNMRENLRDLLDLALPTRADAAVYARAMALSDASGHHLSDTLYHAVALETEGAVLVTADERYLVKARRHGQAMALSEWDAAPA